MLKLDIFFNKYLLPAWFLKNQNSTTEKHEKQPELPRDDKGKNKEKWRKAKIPQSANYWSMHHSDSSISN